MHCTAVDCKAINESGAAKREIAPGAKPRSRKGLNSRAENSHLPFRKRERAMQGYQSPGLCSGSYQSIQPSGIASPFLPVAALH